VDAGGAAPTDADVRREAARAHREGWVRILPFVGLALGAVALVLLGLLALDDGTLALNLLISVGVLFSAGKEAAIPGGVSLGVDPWLMAGWMILVDVAATFLLYPVVHITLDSMEFEGGFLNRKMPFAGRMVRGAVRRAEKHRRIVERFGVVGLFLYSIIPFGFNGPPIVAALGRLCGLHAVHIVPVLVAAITVTSLGWALFYDQFFREVKEHLHPLAPIAISVTVIVVMLGIAIVGAIRDKAAEAAETQA
jgi:uncharacterized membrane protein